MEKNWKKIGCFVLSLSLIVALGFGSSMNVEAVTLDEFSEESTIPQEPEDYGDPISVNKYVDEDGCLITEKLYFVSDSNLSIVSSTSGAGWFKNEKTYDWTTGTTTYYATGYFVWGDGDVAVSSPAGGANDVTGITRSNISLTYGTGNYAGIFNKYAYVTYSFTASNSIGNSHNLSVTIRVSQSGNTI